MRKLAWLALILCVSWTFPHYSQARQTPPVERLIILAPVQSFSKSGLIKDTSALQAPVVQRLEELSSSGKVDYYQPFWLQNMVLAVGDRETLESFSSFPCVIAVAQNKRVFAPHSARKSVATEVEWNLKAIGAPDVWSAGNMGEGAMVGVLDTGCDSTHPEVAGKIQTFATFDSYGRKGPQTIATDSDGHGTGVCSVIAGGTVGVAPKAKLIVGQVIPEGSGSLSQIIAGLQWITDPDDNPDTDDYPRVVNMSFGAPGTLDFLRTAIKNLRTFGILPVASIGNEGEGNTSNPGNMPEVFSVGSVDAKLNASSFSGGESVTWEDDDEFTQIVKPDICAPGEGIRVAGPRRTYDTVDGTSLASPHVAGLCALIMSEKGRLPPEDLMNSIIETAKDLGRPGKDKRFGHGFINCKGAVDALKIKEVKTVTINWATGSSLWGDINLSSGNAQYAISRIQAGKYSFLHTPGDTITASAFGFTDEPVTADTVTLRPLPIHTVKLLAQTEGTSNNVECRAKVVGSPLPIFEAPDGNIEMALPEGPHKVSISSFGHAVKTLDLNLTGDTSQTVDLTPALLAFIDDRRSFFGLPPTAIRSRIEPALKAASLPYFYWRTSQGRVSSSQLSKFPYVVWNASGALTSKETQILGGYMDLGGKLILTSTFYGASYFGQNEGTVFLNNYFHCTPNDEGGAAVMHWDGKSFKSLALGSSDRLFSSSQFTPLSHVAKPVLTYAGTSPRKNAALLVSTLKNQGVILGFTLQDIASEADRIWLLNLCIGSFSDTFLWGAQIAGSDGAKPAGTLKALGQTMLFEDGQLSVPCMSAGEVSIEISSFGYDTFTYKGPSSGLQSQITLKQAPLGQLGFDLNKDAYILFDELNVPPKPVAAKGSVSLPQGNYNLTLVAKGHLPLQVDTKVPGSVKATFLQAQSSILIKDDDEDVSNALSSIGLSFDQKPTPQAKDIISSGMFIWSTSNKPSGAEIDLLRNIKTALLCEAKVILAGAELVRVFGDPIGIESSSTQVYASMGEGPLDGVLISTSSAMRNYDTSIPTLAGGESLAQFIGQGPSIIRIGGLVACSFDFKSVDLSIVKAELLRRLAWTLGNANAKLPSPEITSPSTKKSEDGQFVSGKPITNDSSVKVSGFAPPGSSSVLFVGEKSVALTQDPEGYFEASLELEEGSYECKVASTNGALTSRSLPVTITVDRTAPLVKVVCPLGGRTPAQEVEVLANIVGASQVKLDGLTVELAGNSLRHKVLSGTGTVLLSATDEAGNKKDVVLRYTPDPMFAFDAAKSNAFFEVGQIAAANMLALEPNQFSPESPLAKKTMAIWVCNALGIPPNPGKSTYTDTPTDMAEEPYIGALVTYGAISGKGKFNPDGPCTKELLVQVLANALKLKKMQPGNPFLDVPQNSPYFKGINMATNAKIIDPKDARVFAGGKFGQGQTVKRSQAAIVLYNVLLYRARGQ